MSKVNLYLANGFEEVEALTVVDILRRAEIECNMVSVTGEKTVTGSHGIAVSADLLFEEAGDCDMLVLPGGMPGTINLKNHEGLVSLIKQFDEDQAKKLAAICAAPTVFGELGLLVGKKATCYPGMENGLLGALLVHDAVCVDGSYTTSRGMGTAIEFGLCLVAQLKGKEAADKIAYGIVHTEQNR